LKCTRYGGRDGLSGWNVLHWNSPEVATYLSCWAAMSSRLVSRSRSGEKRAMTSSRISVVSSTFRSIASERTNAMWSSNNPRPCSALRSCSTYSQQTDCRAHSYHQCKCYAIDGFALSVDRAALLDGHLFVQPSTNRAARTIDGDTND